MSEKWSLGYFIDRDPKIMEKISPSLSNGSNPDFIAHLNSHTIDKPKWCPFCEVLRNESPDRSRKLSSIGQMLRLVASRLDYQTVREDPKEIEMAWQSLQQCVYDLKNVQYFLKKETYK